MYYPILDLTAFFKQLKHSCQWHWVKPPRARALLSWPKNKPYHPNQLTQEPSCIVLDKHIYFYDMHSQTLACALSSLSRTKLVKVLAQLLPPLLAPKLFLHGVLLSIHGKGVLLRGPANSGKSYCAFQLIQRGHQLVCDDAPCFYLNQNSRVMGGCPENIKGLLYLRGNGLTDIGQNFGLSSIKTEQTLDLIIQLNNNRCTQPHLQPCYQTVLGVNIPTITLPLALFTNAAMLVESAVHASR